MIPELIFRPNPMKIAIPPQSDPYSPGDWGNEGVDDSEVDEQLGQCEDENDEVEEYPKKHDDYTQKFDILGLSPSPKEICEVIDQDKSCDQNDEEHRNVGQVDHDVLEQGGEELQPEHIGGEQLQSGR